MFPEEKKGPPGCDQDSIPVLGKIENRFIIKKKGGGILACRRGEVNLNLNYTQMEVNIRVGGGWIERDWNDD